MVNFTISVIFFMKQGDKLICLNNINNDSKNILFKKGKIYKILYVNNESISINICIEHDMSLKNSDYYEFDVDWVNKNFKKL